MWDTVELGYEMGTIMMMVVCTVAMMMTRQTLDLLAAAGVLFSFTYMSMWIVDSYPAPWHSAHMVVQDLICAGVAWWAARRTSERWPHWIKIAFTVQCGIHVLYWGGLFLSRTLLDGSADRLLTSAYPWPINALFLIELAILTVAGGGHVARNVRARLRRLRGGSQALGGRATW